MMKHCKFILLIPCMLVISGITVYGQNAEKMRERLKAYKKIMLMEKLKMNEEQSIKFFSRYAEHEELIKKAKSDIDHSVELLELSIESGKGDADKAIQTIFEKDLAMKKTIIDRMKAMKPVLSDAQYAKYILIEYSLLDDVKEAIKKRRK